MATQPSPKTIIKQLRKSGLNERRITDALNADGVSVTQATINRIRTGHIKRTGFDIGHGLVRLLERHKARTGAPLVVPNQVNGTPERVLTAPQD